MDSTGRGTLSMKPLSSRLAYSSNAYMRYPIEDAIRRIADLGYLGIELMFDTPHAWPEDVTPGQIDAIRSELDRHRLTVANVNAFMMNKIADPRQPYWHPSWIEPDATYRQIRIEHTRRSLTLARQLGARHISTEPGGPLTDESQRERAMGLFVEMLKPVLDHAAREGVKLLIEPEPGLLIETSEQFLDLRARIDSPAMGLNFDIGHVFCVGESPARAVRTLAPHIDHVHVEDIAATRVHHHLVPGTGAIDFAETFAALEEIGYEGWLTVELYPFIDDPDGAGRQARSHLLGILETVQNRGGRAHE
ncbi:MAG: xylose isomerase [Phycisphaerae bacterium]